MLSFQKWRCSWSLVAAIASVVALVSVVHLFLFPVVPSLDYSSSRQQVQNSCLPISGSIQGEKVNAAQNPPQVIDLEAQFPADLHKAVVYRGAPWKAEIGRWLAGCNSITNAVNVSEKIGGKSCKNDCSGQGICNHELGQCRCFHGFSVVNRAQSGVKMP